MKHEIDYLPKGWYKNFKIIKKNKSERKIAAPSYDLLEYQKERLKEIEKTYHKIVNKTDIQNTAHGFISNRNCVTAAMQHIGFDATIIIDISNFFDSVSRAMFAVRPDLKKIFNDDNLFHLEGYAAQGFSTSPMIANIAIVPALMHINEFLRDKFDKNYAFTIYADDIHISIKRKRRQHDKTFYKSINNIIYNVVNIVEESGFEINKNKTHIRYAKYGYRKILGINVGEDHIRASRKTMRKIRAAKHQGNYHSLGGLTTWSKNLLPKKLR